MMILLMAEILHHLGCIKPCKEWDKLPINWCRISAINSRTPKKLHLGKFRGPDIEICLIFPPLDDHMAGGRLLFSGFDRQPLIKTYLYLDANEYTLCTIIYTYAGEKTKNR